MLEQRPTSDTSKLSMVLFRLALFALFLVMVGRLFQLQIVEGESYRTRADDNRFEEVEAPAPRGVIYDRNGAAILARNRPSFQIALVPEDLPFDDPATTLDERTAEITRILQVIHADTDRDVALRIAELMFRRLGRLDYARAVEGAGIELPYVRVRSGEQTYTIDSDGFLVQTPEFIEIPDISQPLPMTGLVALVQRAIAIGELGSASDDVPILDVVERLQAQEIAEEVYRLPAIRVNPAPVREYVYGDLVSHVLGFMGPIPAALAQQYRENGYANPNERVGLSGLEASYQTELRGAPGRTTYEVDILGRRMRAVGEVREPTPGLNLILNIDLRLQQAMRDALQSKMEEIGAQWGVTIAMNPQNGAVLGMVSLPSYNNNVFAERINEDYLALERDDRKPLINYAIGGLYPPGSTFKMVTATAALVDGVVGKHTTITDAGPMYLMNEYFPNDLSQAQRFVSWNHRFGIVHGPMNVIQAMALSNDIYFYWIGGGQPRARFRGLGDKKLAEWAALYGYGERTGIDLPGEVGVVLPTDQWKRQLFAEVWTTGDSYNAAIGQGYILATPLQVLVSTATIANGGTVYQPQVVYQMVDAAGGLQYDYTPKVVRQLPVSREIMETIRESMWAVVNTDIGTGAAVRIDGVTIAGKTGTAEFCEVIEVAPEEYDCRRTENDNLPTHASFVAFAPYENPEIAVVTFVYEGGEGSQTAVPITRAILEAYFTQISPHLVAN
ncbi:MAG: penicillin-binding protein 2 [Caldilineaceae bacterium]|nr:penicillin-binding protein 2 [Caldilineaceae bacterium]